MFYAKKNQLRGLIDEKNPQTIQLEILGNQIYRVTEEKLDEQSKKEGF